ncbi:amidase family protein [Pseudonocardia acaciae]|uniref:amidase family protein n=1 Tax=Pseudonocardia acaciae TaxID=551276 RepID=UPI00055EC150|nr:amidase family protein [Pseudonocardia acaciae]
MTGLDDAVLGRATSQALTERALDALRRHADRNAVITLAEEPALRAAWQVDHQRGEAGPLHGVPIVVKDNIHVGGLPNTAATPAMSGFVPAGDAPAVARLRAAGAVVLAKANMHELSMGVTGAASAAGPALNARDAGHIAGGSSSGTAVAVALGVPAGLGTDTGGSVRIPAALNGVCGLRPTRGRYPTEAITPLSGTRDTPGPIAHTVADLALLDSVLAGEPVTRPLVPPATGLRIGVPTSWRRAPADPSTVDAFEAALELLRGAGVTVIDVPNFEVNDVEQRIGLPIVAFEARRELTRYLAAYLPSLTLSDLVEKVSGERVRAFFQGCVLDGAPGAIAEEAYDHAIAHGRGELHSAYRRAFGTYDLHALAFPTTPQPAAPAGADEASAFDVLTRNTAPGSLIGLPGLTLPIPTENLPIGLSLDGTPGGDRALLATAHRLEHILTQVTART